MKKERNNAIMLQCDNAVMLQCRMDEQPTGQSMTAFGSLIHCLWVSPLLSEGQSCTAFGSVVHCLWVTPRVSGSQSSTALGSVDHCLWVTSPLSTSQSTTAFGSYAHCLWVSSRVSAGQSSTEYKSVSGCFSAPGWRPPQTIVPLEKGGGDFGAGGLKFYNSLFLIAYFLFSENVKYRIRNHQSGNEEASYKLATTYPSLQTRGRKQACQRATHLTTPDTTPVGNTTPTGLVTLSGWTTLSGCGKNEIQFSRYPGLAGTVIHRAQAVRACLPPFYF